MKRELEGSTSKAQKMANTPETSVADHTQPEATTAAVSTSDNLKPDIAIPAI